MRHYSLPLTVLSSFCLSTLATAQDLPPVDSSTLLKALEQVEAKHAEINKSQAQRAIQDFKAAMGSDSKATAFYEEAVRATQFMGQNQQQTQFQEWKKKESPKYQQSEVQMATRLNLTYTIISLEFASGMPVEKLIPALLQYTNQVLDYRAGLKPEQRAIFDRQEMINTSVSSGIFARWYGIDKTLAGLKNWGMSPGKVDDIYLKTILPELRKMKDPKAVQYWDARIAREEKAANEGNVTFKIEQFTQVQKPALLWSRAEELLALGMRNRAINEMFAVIKNTPASTETPGRIEKLKALLAPPPVPVMQEEAAQASE
jgi:hypothetical protein